MRNITPVTVRFSLRAFTLIELLTVIAIIGILAAIIIPTVGKVRQTAKTATCVSNMRQISTALSLYAGDHKGRLPLPTGNSPSGYVGTGGTTWHQEVEPYIPPRDKNSWYAGHNPVFTCPSIQWDGVSAAEAGATYTLIGAGVGLNTAAANPPNDSASNVYRNISSIVTPSLAPWLIDGAQSNPASSTGKYYARYSVRNANIHTDITGVTNVNSDWRHGDALNAAMADGSIKKFNRSDWLTTFPVTPVAPSTRANQRFLGVQ